MSVIKWLILFVIVPIFLGWLILKAGLVKSNRISLPEDNKASDAVQIDIKETPLDELRQALFGNPLKLHWYTFCLVNKNELSINNTKVQLPYEKDPEAGSMEIKINYQDGSSDQIYASVVSKEPICKQVKISNTVENITAEFRKPRPSTIDPVLKNIEIRPNGGTIEASKSAFVHTENSYITFKYNWIEFISKMIIILIGWMVLVVNFIESTIIFKKKN